MCVCVFMRAHTMGGGWDAAQQGISQDGVLQARSPPLSPPWSLARLFLELLGVDLRQAWAGPGQPRLEKDSHSQWAGFQGRAVESQRVLPLARKDRGRSETSRVLPESLGQGRRSSGI